MEYRISTQNGRIWDYEEWKTEDRLTKQQCVHWNHLDPIVIPSHTTRGELQKIMYAIYSNRKDEGLWSKVDIHTLTSTIKEFLYGKHRLNNPVPSRLLLGWNDLFEDKKDS